MLVFLVFLALRSVVLCDTTSVPENRCGRFETHKKCKTICPPQFCNISLATFGQCNPILPCIPGCDCMDGYQRDNDGICVLIEKCPPPRTTPQCGEFEVASDCTDVYLEPSELREEKCIDMDRCTPGCKCIEKYVRDSNGACVPIPPDLPCGINEEASTCKKVCPPQSCKWNPKKLACKPGPCRAGCNCILDYVRDESGHCIPKDQCPSDTNKDKKYEGSDVEILYLIDYEKYSPSKSRPPSIVSTVPCKPEPPGETPCIYDQCTPTCSIPNPTNCPQISDPATNRCNCAEGYILSEKGGQCVKLEECPKYKNCNGDRNATFRECPNNCLSTCKDPNGKCSKKCETGGCQCNPLYILSDEGKCILPNECPGGNPCSKNETFVYCKAGCPTNYCPVNDNRAMVACSPPYPCASGCACQRNHKRLSRTDDRCILASDCPPVKCTRQHEVWNSCPPPCFSDKCRDLKTTRECFSGSDCQPQCVCKENYRRNSSDICVSVAECPAE